ncbi:MAG: outer membrane protein assembly factor BamB [Pseudoalteromonas tetraodonis]|jgi:outer membrane protein assembly factor BamB
MLYSRRFAVSIAVSVLAISGCASKGKVDAEPFEPVLQQGIDVTGLVPDARWTASLKTNKDLIFAFSPMVVGETLCASGQRAVACYDFATGERRWRNKHKGLSAGVAMSDELVIAATATGSVIAWDVATGAVLWKADAGAEVTATPAIGSLNGMSVVVVNTGAGRVRAFDAKDGSELWGHEQQVPSLTLRGNATPLIHKDVVLVGFDNGHLMSIGLVDGQVEWDTTVGRPEGRTELDRIVDIDSAPVVRRNDVYSSAYNSQTRAIDLKTGREVWSKAVSGSAGSNVDEKRLYVAGGDNQLYALDVYSGRIIWQLGTFDDDQEQRRFPSLLTAPAVYKDYVLVADSQGNLHGVKASDGTRVFSKSFAGGYSAAPQIHGDALVMQSRFGKIQVIDLIKLEASDSQEALDAASGPVTTTVKTKPKGLFE